MTRARFARKKSTTTWRIDLSGLSRRLRAEATADGTRLGSATDQPDSLGEGIQQLFRRTQGQAGLARPSRAGHSYQAGLAGEDDLLEVFDLLLTANKRGKLDRQVVHRLGFG